MRQKINEEAIELGKLIVSTIIITTALYFTFKYLESNPVLLLQIENIIKTQRFFNISLNELRNNIIIIILIIRTTFFVKTRGVQIGFMMTLILYGLQKIIFIPNWISVSLIISFFTITLFSYMKNRLTNLLSITIITANCLAITIFIIPTYTKTVKPEQFYRLQKNYTTSYSLLSPTTLKDANAQITISHGEKKQTIELWQEKNGIIEIFSGDKITFASKTGLDDTYAKISFQDGTFILLKPQTTIALSFEINIENLQARRIETAIENGTIIVSNTRPQGTAIEINIGQEKISLTEGWVSKNGSTIGYSKNLTGNQQSGNIFQNFQSGWVLSQSGFKERDYSKIIDIKKGFANNFKIFIKNEYGRSLSDTITLEDIILSKMIVGSIIKPETYRQQLKEFQKLKYFLPNEQNQQIIKETPITKLNNYLIEKYNLTDLIGDNEKKERETYKIR